MVRNRPVTRRMGCCSSKSKKKFNFLATVQLTELDNSGSSDTDSSDRDEAQSNRGDPNRQLEMNEDMREREALTIPNGNRVQVEDLVQNEEFFENRNEQESEDYYIHPEGDDAQVLAHNIQGLLITPGYPPAEDMDDTIPLEPPEDMNRSDSDGPMRLPRNENRSQLSIPRSSFDRLCRGIFQHYKPGCRVQRRAYEALQEAAEDYMAGVFVDAYKITVVRKKVTLQPQDMKLAMEIRGDLNLIPGPSPLTNRRFSSRCRRICNSV